MSVLTPKAEIRDTASGGFEILFYAGDNGRRGALESEPSKIAGPSANEGLGEGKKRYEQSRRNRIVFGLQARMDHVGKRHEQRAAEHDVGDDAQEGEGNRDAQDKEGEG